MTISMTMHVNTEVLTTGLVIPSGNKNSLKITSNEHINDISYQHNLLTTGMVIPSSTSKWLTALAYLSEEKNS